MKRIVRRGLLGFSIILFIMWMATNLTVIAQSVDETVGYAEKKVLMISSYSYDWFSVPKQIEGISSSITVTDNIQYLFMDSKNQSADAIEEQFVLVLENKLNEAGPFDVIILGDDLALDFALKYRYQYFNDTPLVFTGINSKDTAIYAAMKENITGVYEKQSYSETISLALSLYPEATEVVYVVDNTATGQGNLAQFMDCQQEFPNTLFHLINSSEMTEEQIVAVVSQLDEKSVLLYGLLSENAEGKKYTLQEGISLIDSNSVIPVFRTTEGGIGLGILGGSVISFLKMGENTGDIVEEILKGTSISEIPITSIEPEFIFDTKMLDKYGIEKSQLPEESIYINDEVSLWETYKSIFSILIVCAVIVLLIIAFLFIDGRRSKKYLASIRKKDLEILNLLKANDSPKVQRRGIELPGANTGEFERIQEELTESSIALRAALNHSNMFSWTYDFDEDTMTLSDRTAKVLNLPITIPRIPKGWFDTGIMLSRYVGEFEDEIQKLRSGQSKSVQFDVRMRIPGEDTLRWERIKCTSIKEENGLVKKAIGTAFDISEQKIAEKKYADEVNYRKTWGRKLLYSYRCNLTTGILEDCQQNDGTGRFYPGQVFKDNEFLESLSFSNDTNDEKKEKIAGLLPSKLLHDYNKGKRNERKREFQILLADDEKIWVRLTANTTKNPLSGEIIAIYNIWDINEEKLLQLLVDALLEKNYEYFGIFDVYSGKVSYFNRKNGDNLTHVQDTMDYMMTIKELSNLYNEDEREDIVRQLSLDRVKEMLDLQGTYSVTSSYLDRGGTRCVKRMFYTYLSENSSEVCCASQDVSAEMAENERQKEILRIAVLEAKQAYAAKQDFLSRMSHDLRTPINAVMGMSTLGEDETTDNHVRHYFTKIRESGAYLLGVVNDILDMSRIESGTVPFNEEVVETAQFCQSILDIFKSNLQERHITIKFDMEKLRSPYVKMDVLRTKQVYVNLFSNAIKFSKDNSVIEWNAETLNIANGRAYNRISIVDHGCGMSEEFLTRVFEPFEQERTEENQDVPGTGLGLPICKNLVEQMGGSISVESTLGEGTTVIVCVAHELADRPERVNEDKEKNELAAMEVLSGKKILLCEDQPINTEIATRLLEKMGLIVFHAENGVEGVERFKESDENFYDAILMDIRMPIMGGWDATVAIRALNRADAKRIPIIAMTANAFEEDIQKSYDVGMNAHLTKPINPLELTDTLVKLS